MREKRAVKCRQTKKRFIDAASDIISKDGASALTVRRISRELNCNSANTYYYFEDLDELMAYASIEPFVDYLLEVSRRYDEAENGLAAYCAGWELFIDESAEKPLLFEVLVYGKYSVSLGQIMAEYYELYPERLLRMTPDIMKNITNRKFCGRSDRMIISRCVEEGYFSADDSGVLGETLKYVHIGLLQELMNGDISAEEYKKRFFDIFDKLIEMFRKK